MGLAESKQEALKVERGEKILESVHGITPATGWFLLLGPLAAFMMKYYLLTVTDKAIYFHRMNMASKIVQSDRFSYAEMKGSKLSSGILNHELKFKFKNGRTLLVRCPRKALSKKVTVLSEKTLDFLEKNFS